MRRLVALLAVLIFAAGVGSAEIAVSNGRPLAFGSVVAHPTTGGTVTISPTGQRTSSGGTFPFGGAAFGAGSFTVTIAKGRKDFTILLPATATLTHDSNTAEKMTVVGFTSEPTGIIKAQRGEALVTVGATLQVRGGQQPGTYSGTYNVTVVQQ